MSGNDYPGLPRPSKALENAIAYAYADGKKDGEALGEYDTVLRIINELAAEANAHTDVGDTVGAKALAAYAQKLLDAQIATQNRKRVAS